MYFELSSLGEFYPLSIYFDERLFQEELATINDGWRVYNTSKPHMRRYGLSLFSLNGETDGIIDLNSILEYNIANGTNLSEMSFRTPTKYWKHLSSISGPLAEFEPLIGRSHLIRLDEGGFFPPHRDLGTSFRLISFLSSSCDGLYVVLNGKKIFYEQNRLYFMDTRLSHALFNMMPKAIILVINLEVSADSVKLVRRHLAES